MAEFYRHARIFRMGSSDLNERLADVQTENAIPAEREFSGKGRQGDQGNEEVDTPSSFEFSAKSPW